MPLEACMVIVDNSESARNGDYAPNRFDAQQDAVNIVFDSITNGNPESSVGLMSMGGKGPEVLSTLTTERGKLLEGLHRTRKKIAGVSHLATGIQIASLALKHRQNKSQRQRIIVFVCSPVADDEKKLVSLAKKMKKSTVDIDFVLFGDLDDDEVQKKLTAFNNAVKGSSDSSHLVVIPPSGKLLSDQLISSPILLGESAAGGAGGGGGGDQGNEFGFDFDPSADPELALALRMSMEEENARQARQAKADEEAAKGSNLEGIKEEDETQPLLDKDGEPSGSGGSSAGKKGGKKDDGDKMDTS